jgi:hypothetical protein
VKRKTHLPFCASEFKCVRKSTLERSASLSAGAVSAETLRTAQVLTHIYAYGIGESQRSERSASPFQRSHRTAQRSQRPTQHPARVSAMPQRSNRLMRLAAWSDGRAFGRSPGRPVRELAPLEDPLVVAPRWRHPIHPAQRPIHPGNRPPSAPLAD